MAVRRAFRRTRKSIDLSIDSLIDVFMNVLGVLMITAVVLALATPSNISKDDKRDNTDSRPVQQEETSPNQSMRPAVQLSLPQVETAATNPLYLLLTSEGIRAFSSADPAFTQQYFTMLDVGDSIRLLAIPGRVMGVSEIQAWLRNHNPATRHVTAVITPGGEGYYRQLRQLASDEGFRSGWMDHDSESITLGSDGRSGSLVQ